MAFSCFLPWFVDSLIDYSFFSAAGKILRRELRELAKKDLAVKAKL